MFLGFLWAAFAPVSILLLVVLTARGLRPVMPRYRWSAAAALVCCPIAALWVLDRAEFRTVCTDAGKPVVYRQASADGIFLNSGTANSFGTRYLLEEGFSWMEAPSIYTRGAWTRYERDSSASNPNNIKTTEITALTARYEVREIFSQPFPHTGLSTTQVIDRSTAGVLAKAGRANFDGGRAKWFLGAWGTTDCPSAMRESDNFSAYYHLAKQTLR